MDGFVEIKNGMTYLASRKLWESRRSVAHFFSTRTGGVSKVPFDTLNLGRYSTDEEADVNVNFHRIAEAATMEMDHIVYMNQVHGDRIIGIHALDELVVGLEADAVVTNLKKVAIGVFTADCVPMLLYDPSSETIAAVHAGWKGTDLGIVKKAIDCMKTEFGSDPKSTLAAIGPAIGACCFEVGDEVAERFVSRKLVDVRWHVDLLMENHTQLLQAGLDKSNIDTCGLCTVCRQDLFFSYRRDAGRTGRLGAFIQLI